MAVSAAAPPASHTPSAPNLHGIRRDRLFVASCCALAVSAVAFAVVGDILGTLKAQFVLSNLEVGYIGGAAIWGFSMSILLLGPLCDVLGMRFLIRSAMVCHFAGVMTIVVHQHHGFANAKRKFSIHLKTSANTKKIRQPCLNRAIGYALFRRHCDCRKRI